MKINFSKKIVISLAILAIILPLIASAADDNIIKNLTSAVQQTSINTSNTDLAIFIGKIIQFILGFLGIIFVSFIIYGGFMYMTAGGDDGQVKKSKELIKNSVIGVIIILAAYAITFTVISKVQEQLNGATSASIFFS